MATACKEIKNSLSKFTVINQKNANISDKMLAA